LEARHLLGIGLLGDERPEPEFADPDGADLPVGDPLPELSAGQLSPALIRAGILRDGCVLVRGLIPCERALALARGIEAAYGERNRRESDGDSGTGLYEEFQPHPPFGAVEGRSWIQSGGGLLGADSPQLAFAMFEAYDSASIGELVSGYLGEPALISVHKTTLRRADPSVPGAWHQDGRFMGPVRSLNLWLSLSRCGDRAPGIDMVPRRLDDYVAAGTDDAPLAWTVSDQQAQAAAGSRGVIRPIFEPGDALFFDELFLHKTGSSPDMPDPRYAVENWFFGASAFPDDYAPLAV
jgi:hypothetical protein